MQAVTSERDGEQISLLAKRYGPAVYRYLRRRLPSDDMAEDLTQDVFANLLRQSRLGEVANIEGYIFTIASNLLKDRLRREQRKPLVLGDEYDRAADKLRDEIDPERVAAGKQTYEIVLRALQALPERQRMVLMLSRFERMTGKDIAARFSISVRQVEKDLSNAIKFLRSQIS